jgi:hypothetical protein
MSQAIVTSNRVSPNVDAILFHHQKERKGIHMKL